MHNNLGTAVKMSRFSLNDDELEKGQKGLKGLKWKLKIMHNILNNKRHSGFEKNTEIMDGQITPYYMHEKPL